MRAAGVDASRAAWQCISASEAETRALARRLAAGLAGGEVLALIGDLGAGKTRFVQGLAEGLGIAPRDVSSPTFAIRHDHVGRLPLVHLDFYRLRDPDEIEWLGVLESAPGAVLVIEWADRLPDTLPEDRLEIVFTPGETPESRTLAWTARGPLTERALAAFRVTHGG